MVDRPHPEFPRGMPRSHLKKCPDCAKAHAEWLKCTWKQRLFADLCLVAIIATFTALLVSGCASKPTPNTWEHCSPGCEMSKAHAKKYPRGICNKKDCGHYYGK